jgi:hypothetical protein
MEKKKRKCCHVSLQINVHENYIKKTPFGYTLKYLTTNLKVAFGFFLRDLNCLWNRLLHEKALFLVPTYIPKI